jgi:hypothetical protein
MRKPIAKIMRADSSAGVAPVQLDPQAQFALMQRERLHRTEPRSKRLWETDGFSRTILNQPHSR